MRGLSLICVISGLLLASSVQEGSSNVTTSAVTSQSPTNSTILPTTSNNNTAPTGNPPSNNTTSAQNMTTVATNQTVTTPTISNETSTTTNVSHPTDTTNTTEPADTTETSPDVNATTEYQNATTEQQKATTKIPTTSKPSTCTGSICGNQATCLQLNNTYVCLCQLNYYYNEGDSTCKLGESFFGVLDVNMKFNPNPSSQEYVAVYKHVLDKFQDCFRSSEGYMGTTILDMRAGSPAAQTGSSRNTDKVSVNVGQIFTPGTTTALDVDKTMSEYFTANPTFGTYAGATLCSAGFYCDAETTSCAETADGQSAMCTCKAGHYSSSSIYTSCRECNPTCGSSEGQYCMQKNPSDLPTCACKVGYKTDGEKCKTCDFGYSGEECKDNFLLILVIVGAVLGVAVVSLLGAVIGITVRSKKGKKNNEHTQLINKIDDMYAESSAVPQSLFPKVRAKPDLGHVNTASNVYEENDSYSRSMPKRDYEDENPWYEMSQKDRQY